ncbi:MAG: glycosyltransferase family 2 protein [Bacteroidales bacterium]|nr:glycosyltransferase family 2 protein [Bacteroidales bacterium]
MTKVSIIIPIYKVEPYIAACARSVLSQTWPECEFIFVDDGSPDRSTAILKELIDSEFTDLMPRITIIVKPVNEGLPQARLTGLKAATGDYVMHVDSDDWVDVDMAEKLVKEAERTGADVVYHYVAKENGEGKVHIAKDKQCKTPLDFAKAIMARRAHGYLVCKFMKRSLYTPDLFYPTISMHEDIILGIQILSRARKAVLLKEAPYHYRRTVSTSFTRQSRSVRHRASARSFLQLYEFYHGFRHGPEDLTWIREPLLDYCTANFLHYDKENLPAVREPFFSLPVNAKRSILRLLLSFLGS